VTGRPRRLATIDLGTNTVRLLVVEAHGRAWRPLGQGQRVTRLGEGQARAGRRLLEEPVRRTLETVVGFVEDARRLGAEEVRVVATSAVREACNRADFCARVRAATGLDVQVVSGEDEARLALLGVAAGLPELDGTFVLLDIGGGSTELVRARRGRAETLASLALGVVSLTEAHLEGPGPVDWTRYEGMRREIRACLERDLPPAIAAAPAPGLVGTAGTVTTLAALDLGLEAYDPARVQGHRLSRATVERLLRSLGAMSVAERGRLGCLEPGRADVLIAGIAICLAVMEHLGRDALVVSDQGLREGILCELLGAP
jgi:exopolyphosphatase/guanosine-5'-triphosphate,3'-diphosphate pyrophosphatase